MATPQLPGALRLIPSFPFVGRSGELTALRTLMPSADGEGRRVALIGGEPGSGKSRLVREFAHEAANEGALVLYGACDAVLRTPYRPFVEALDYLVRNVDPSTLRTDLGSAGGELTRLLPDLPARVGDLPGPVVADQDTERHRLHTAVTDLLSSVGRRQPVLLVLEDGHWADGPTLLLLRHLARSATDARMLLVATFRDTEAEMPVELADSLADLRRADDVVRLRLGGLSGTEIEEFVRGAASATAEITLTELASAIGDLTEGNAFLLCELWRTLIETDAIVIDGETAVVMRPLAELATPESVREVVSQRLSRLAPETRDLLELSAVAGPEFELDMLRGTGLLPEPALPHALDEAVRTGMVEEVPGRGLAFRFTHELVRRALYDRLSSLRRAELHLRVAEALERASVETSRPNLAGLAYHFAEAAPLGSGPKAVEYNVLAAHAARSALAFDEAATRLRTALDLGIEDDRERTEALLELGAVCYQGGASADSLDAFRSAAHIARTLGDGDLFARAAVGLENACWRPGIVDQFALELLDEASESLDEGDSELRVMVLAGLVRSHEKAGHDERGAVVRVNAIAMARRLGDRRGLATVLMRAYWARGTLSLEEILDMLAEARDLGEQIGDPEIQAEAIEWRLAALIALGDLETAERELADVLELASTMRQPFIIHVAEHNGAAISLCKGDLEKAEARAERSHEWSRLLTGRDPSAIYGVQMFSIRREQGRLAELAPVIRVLAGGARTGGAWRPGLAALLAELGMEDEARRELVQLRREGLAALRESLWLASLTYLTDACAHVGDAELAEMVYAELGSHAGTNVTIGHGVACYGAADRYLGMLAATIGERDLAQRHFEEAMALNRSMGARTWLAHTAYEYGRLLVAHGGTDGRAESMTLLAEAGTLAERIGMSTLMARVSALGSPVRPANSLPDGLSPREVDILRLVARGLSNREIGTSLVISEHTAANHVRSILRKTGCANRTEAASYAHSRGLAKV